MPRYLFFLLIGAVAVGLLAVLRRLRAAREMAISKAALRVGVR
jgi:hypothetical protein